MTALDALSGGFTGWRREFFEVARGDRYDNVEEVVLRRARPDLTEDLVGAALLWCKQVRCGRLRERRKSQKTCAA